MIKRVEIAFAAVMAAVLVFTFMPTGVSTADILSGYTSTLSYYGNGVYEVLSPETQVADPLLLAAEKELGEICPYIWVTTDGTPVTGFKKNSTFPMRKGDTTIIEDNTKIPVLEGDEVYDKPAHRGTDFGLNPVISPRPHQVTMWSGKVIEAGYSDGWGNQVLVAHGNNLYTRYAHMSELFVTAGEDVAIGDPIGVLGSTGRSSGDHAHIELFLCPNGYISSTPTDQATYYYAGVDNLLRGGKTLSQIKWYQIAAGKDSIDDTRDYEEVLNG